MVSSMYSNTCQFAKGNPMIKRCYKKWVIITSLLTVIAGIMYLYFYMRHYIWHEINRTDTGCYLGDVWEGFYNFKQVEKRWPVSMIEAEMAPYNKHVLSHKHTKDTFYNEPFQCVTTKNMYLYNYTSNNSKDKVLVTSHKPYRTRLWPFGEIRIYILYDHGGIGAVAPSEIIVE